jgi:hypothetical protein
MRGCDVIALLAQVSVTGTDWDTKLFAAQQESLDQHICDRGNLVLRKGGKSIDVTRI